MRSISFERIRCKLHLCLEFPVTNLQIAYHFLICLVVAVSLIVYSFIDYDPLLYSTLRIYLVAIELVLVIYFAIELCVRIVISGMDSRFSGCQGRLHYLCRPIMLFDILVLMGTILTLLSVSGVWVRKQQNAWLMEYFKFLQLFRFLHLDRKSSTLYLLKKVFYLHRKELFTSIFIGSFCVMLIAAIVSWTEGCYDDPTCQMSDYGNTLYWSFMTYLAIGYGELTPKHWVSKVLVAVSSIILVSVFYLIPSLLGFGFSLMLENRRIKSHMKIEQPRAATLIQTFWRLYLIRERFDKIAFYNDVYVHNLIADRLDIVQPSRWNSMIRSVSLNSIVGTFQKRKCSITYSDVSSNSGSRTDFFLGTDRKLSRTRNSCAIATVCHSQVLSLDENDSADEGASLPLPSTPPVCKRSRVARHYSQGPDKYVYVLVAIWHMKFLVAKRKFQLMKTGVDLYDVSLQISECQAIALTKLQNLQHKIDIVVEQLKSKPPDSKNNKERDMSRKIVHLETTVNLLQSKVELLTQKLCMIQNQRLVSNSN